MTTLAPVPIGPALVFFGDSLSDPGNLAAAGAGLIDPAAIEGQLGPGGQASNGPVFTEYLAPFLGVAQAANYAVAGAEAAGSQTLRDFATDSGATGDLLVPLDDPALDWDMNLTAQTARYQADTAAQDRSATTAFILIGGNDYAGIDLSNAVTALASFAAILPAVIDATMANVQTLLGSGVGRVIVSSLPSAALFPVFAGLSSADKALAQTVFAAHDAALAQAVADLAATGAPVHLFDQSFLGDAIVEDPESFGILAPLALTLTSGDAALAGYDSDQVAFWDELHPTTALHGVIASYGAMALEHGASILDSGANTLQTLSARDLVLAYGGADTLLLGGSDDVAFGGSGDDSLNGGTGADLLSGGSGIDSLLGAAGDDVLDGDGGNDWIGGGRGNDVLIDGLGDDTMAGGGGDDLFIFCEASLIGGSGLQATLVQGGVGVDTLVMVLSDATLARMAADWAGLDNATILSNLGISVGGIEAILFVAGRENLPPTLDLSQDTDWFSQADHWGLI